MLYQILSLPAIPAQLKAQAWAQAYAHGDTLNKWVLGSPHGRELVRDGHVVAQSTGLGRKRITEEFEQWVCENITDEFNDIGVCVSEPGLDHSGPHRDQSRNYTLLYLLQSGGDNATTKFWKTREPELELHNYYSSYDELELLDQISAPLETWCILDSKAIHSVENISEGRVSIQVSLNRNPWHVTK